MTDEGKEDDINKCPNVSGFIHSKRQIERNNSSQKAKDDNGCIII